MRVLIMACLQITENYIVPHDISPSSFIKLKRGIGYNILTIYDTSLDNICILTWKLLLLYQATFAFVTKLLENLLLAKYLISVAAPVRVQDEFCIYFPIINSKGVNSKTVSPPTPNPPLLTLLSLKTLKSAV